MKKDTKEQPLQLPGVKFEQALKAMLQTPPPPKPPKKTVAKS